MGGYDMSTGTQSMTLDSSGNLGIGITTVATGIGQRVLQLTNGTNGMILLGSGATQSPNPRLWGADTYDLALAAGVTTGKLILYTNDLPRMTVAADGNVGIGATPTSFGAGYTVLDVYNGTTGGYILVRNPTHTGQVSVDGTGMAIQTRTSSPIQFIANNTERMRITSAGNVGIGTTTPDAVLQVYQNSGKVATFGNNVNNNGNYIVLAGSISNKNWVISNNMLVGGEFGIGRTSAAGGTIIGSTHDLMIDTSGNVGIGTTANNYRLNIKGSGSVGDSSVYAQFTTLDTGTTNTDGLLIGLGIGSSPIAYINQMENAALSLMTNATERMRIGADGVVSFGNTGSIDSNKVQVYGAKALSSGIPQQQLNIADTSAIAVGVGGAIGFSAQYLSGSYTTMGSVEGVRETATVGHYGGALVFKSRTNFGDNSERMRIDSAGNVAIGTTSITMPLRVLSASNSNWIAAFDNSGTNPYGVRIDTSNNSGSAFSFAVYTNAGTGMYVLNTGMVGFGGTNNPSYPISISQGVPVSSGGNARIKIGNHIIKGSANDDLFIYGYNGETTGGLLYVGGYYTFSARSIKSNIVKLENSLTKICQLNGYSYTITETGRNDIGLIADEVETVFPDLVSHDENNEANSVDYTSLVAVLIESIKEQQSIIESLKTRLTALENK